MMSANGVDRHLINLQAGLPGITDGAAISLPPEPPAQYATVASFAVDQVLGLVLDSDSHDTLIGDLTFEQVSSAPRRARGTAATGTAS
jgi:hypothetical protein